MPGDFESLARARDLRDYDAGPDSLAGVRLRDASHGDSLAVAHQAWDSDNRRSVVRDLPVGS